MFCKECGMRMPIGEKTCPTCGENQDSLIQMEIFLDGRGRKIFENPVPQTSLSPQQLVTETTAVNTTRLERTNSAVAAQESRRTYVQVRQKNGYVFYKMMIVLIFIMLIINIILTGVLVRENTHLRALQNQIDIEVIPPNTEVMTEEHF